MNINPTINFAGRMCYGCLEKTPYFDIKNYPKSTSEVDPTCTYHTNISCLSPTSACFIRVVKDGSGNIIITKGCYLDDSTGCSKTNTETDQYCFCKTSLCNSDIEVLGGKHLSSAFLLKAIKGSYLLSLLLMRCLRHLQTTDEDGLTNDCTNSATSCSSVDCNENKCQEHSTTSNEIPETDCTKGTCNVTGSNAFCRIYYYEVRKCVPECEEGKKNANEGEWYVKQECFVDPHGDTKKDCDFNHKIVHIDEMTRITVEKDCYCDNDQCNTDIGAACQAVKGSNFKTNRCEGDETNEVDGVMKRRDLNSVLYLMAWETLFIFSLFSNRIKRF
ncbi:unnamed protein product [Orchesella dallaii]|uniref:Protein sleepless n=1 Tax=Orchesella dallaii TaxID=48710 RepID=A0ABP1Q859_9HEXA